MYGILEPLVVRRRSGCLELICGHRRLEASRLLGLTEIPVVIRDTPDEDLALVALQENLHRDGMNPLDEAQAYQQVLDSGRARTRAELARLVGVTRGRISQILALLRLPEEVQRLMYTQVNSAAPPLTEKHARILRRIPEVAEQVQFARMAHDDRFSPEQLDRILRGAGRSRKPPTDGTDHAPSTPWRNFQAFRCRSTGTGLQFEVEGRTHPELVIKLEQMLEAFRAEPSLVED